MFLGLDPVLYIWVHLFVVYVTLLRLTVLYSRCRVNRSINLFVVLYNGMYFCFASTACLGSLCGIPNLWGVPHYGCIHSVTVPIYALNPLWQNKHVLILLATNNLVHLRLQSTLDHDLVSLHNERDSLSPP